MSAISLMHVKILCMSFAPHIQVDARVCDEDNYWQRQWNLFPTRILLVGY
jgi:hypothetical protein